MKKLMLLCSFMIICANLSFAEYQGDILLEAENYALIQEARDIVNPPPPSLKQYIKDLKFQVKKYKEYDDLFNQYPWDCSYDRKRKEYRDNIANLLTVIDGRAGKK